MRQPPWGPVIDVTRPCGRPDHLHVETVVELLRGVARKRPEDHGASPAAPHSLDDCHGDPVDRQRHRSDHRLFVDLSQCLHACATLASFTSNGALRTLYGYPYDMGSPTGWSAWRSLGFVVVVMAMWAASITVGALRGEEESGRGELALSQPQSRRIGFTAALVAAAIETLMVGLVNVVGLTVFCVTGGLMTLVISHRPVEVLVMDRGRLGPQHSVRTPGGRCRSERRDDRE